MHPYMLAKEGLEIKNDFKELGSYFQGEAGLNSLEDANTFLSILHYCGCI